MFHLTIRLSTLASLSSSLPPFGVGDSRVVLTYSSISSACPEILAALLSAPAALVAVHAFDCHGAHAVGLTTGWARRLEKHYPDLFTRADVIGDDLVEVASGLVALSPD